VSPFMSLHHSASGLGRVRRRFLALITALTLVAPLLLVGAMPTIATEIDSHSTVTTDAPDPVVVGTTVTITVTPKDESDADLGPGQTVTVSYSGSIDGAHPPVAATDVTDGTYTATIADTVAQVDTITATVNGTTVGQFPTVTFTPGPTVLAQTTIGVDPVAVSVDIGQSTITVQTRDQYGNATPDATHTVVLTPDTGSVGAVTAHADGRYTATLSDTVTRTDTISGTIDTIAIAATPQVQFLPGKLDAFTVEAVADPQTAGEAIAVDTTPLDHWGNVKTDYAGGASVSGDFGTSPLCSSCATPSATPVPGTLGAFDGDSGFSSASVTDYKAELGRTITVTDSANTWSGDPVTGTTEDTFDVQSADPSVVDFADSAVTFNGQPITTKKGTNIYSVCDPSGLTDSPCLATPSSSPVQVLVRDAYGNPISGSDVTLTANSPFGLGGTGTGATTGSDGKASFDTITATPSTKTGSITLTAALDEDAGVTTNSQSFDIVDDLKACDGQSCSSNSLHQLGFFGATSFTPNKGKPAPSPTTQRAYARISTDEDFFDLNADANVLLTTRWIDPITEVNNKCGTNHSLGDAVDIQAQGGLAETTPSTQMVLVLPAKTLQALGVASRGTPSFNVCLGALDLSGTADAWQQKQVTKKVVSLAPSVQDTVVPNRYWGIPADCGFIGLASDDPCIGLRTKQASVAQAYLGLNSTDFAALGIKDSDLVIVIQKPYPWDAKGSIF
jgi:hypothetical protein